MPFSHSSEIEFSGITLFLHAKPPEKGTPFPMHQDYPFYPHDGLDFVDCLVHLDDAPFESGALRVVPGSHKEGPREHITGHDTAPHLPTDEFHPDFIDSIPIPAKAGDVIFFSYCLIHWSEVNRTDDWRKQSDSVTIHLICVLSDENRMNLITTLWRVVSKLILQQVRYSLRVSFSNSICP